MEEKIPTICQVCGHLTRDHKSVYSFQIDGWAYYCPTGDSYTATTDFKTAVDPLKVPVPTNLPDPNRKAVVGIPPMTRREQEIWDNWRPKPRTLSAIAADLSKLAKELEAQDTPPTPAQLAQPMSMYEH